jgi:large subunit ribosomal protein L21
MYAVFEDGSRQYRVSEGDVVKVDYREDEDGSRLEFGRVLLFAGGTDVQIGTPVVEGARVLGEVVGHPSIKSYIQHFRRRKNYRRLKGHRQHYTAVRISNILLKGQEAPAAKPKAEAPPAKPEKLAETKPEKKAEPKAEKKAEAKAEKKADAKK